MLRHLVSKLSTLFLLTPFILLAGCAADRAYRTASANDLTELQRSDKDVGAMIEKPLLVENCDGEPIVPSDLNGISLGFVEVDEQGSFWSRKQVDEVFKLLPPKNDVTAVPVYVLVYVHGWRHDLRWGDDNVCKFKQALRNLRRTLNQRGEMHVGLVGIAVGWRGQSIDQFPLDLLTVLDRKSVSDEVGRGTFVELLTGIEARTKGITAFERKTSRNRLLLVGHSFGASVVHNALGPLLVERLTKDLYQRAQLPPGAKIQPQDIFLQGFGDMVVLVNPAIEAMRFLPLLELAHRATADEGTSVENRDGSLWPDRYKLDPNQPPRLVIVSSLGDFPTRRAFPIVQSLKTIFEKHRTVETIAADGKSVLLNQSELDTTTIGNHPSLATHRTMVRAAPHELGRCPRLEPDWLKNAQESSGNFSTGRGWSMKFPASNIMLEHNTRYAATLPIWIMDVATDIITNHSIVIGGGTLICLFDQLIGSSAAEKNNSPALQSRPAIK